MNLANAFLCAALLFTLSAELYSAAAGANSLPPTISAIKRAKKKRARENALKQTAKEDSEALEQALAEGLIAEAQADEKRTMKTLSDRFSEMNKAIAIKSEKSIQEKYGSSIKAFKNTIKTSDSDEIIAESLALAITIALDKRNTADFLYFDCLRVDFQANPDLFKKQVADNNDDYWLKKAKELSIEYGLDKRAIKFYSGRQGGAMKFVTLPPLG